MCHISLGWTLAQAVKSDLSGNIQHLGTSSAISRSITQYHAKVASIERGKPWSLVISYRPHARIKDAKGSQLPLYTLQSAQ
jgi:hypothetical protein